jgi:hypothetical protein
VATNFLLAAGTNGFLATPFNLQSTELNALANGNSATSSVGGTSGAFTQTNTANAIWGEIAFTAGGSFTPTTGGYIAGWFLYSPDGGTTYETVVANTDMARSPDFIIALNASAYAANNIAQASGIVKLPWWTFKVFVVNHSGATLPATGNLVKLGPVAIQY